MTHYFKLVALSDSDWLQTEFLAGRVRFGWSGPGMDLRVLRHKEERSEEEAITWRYTKFLIERIEPGDRVVLQFDQPLREFWIGEIAKKGYEFDASQRDDFNHILHIKPLTRRAVSAISTIVPAHLRHDLTKRGQYYEIYPQESISALDQIVAERLWEDPASREPRTGEQDYFDTHAHLIRWTIEAISRRWPAKHFERFCERLLESLDFVEVKDPRDTKQGWDLLIRIRDSITGKILLDDVPVQCKNYQGEVSDNRPIDDLKRSILDKHSNSSVAYLFILGDLTEEYRHRIDRAQEELSKGRDAPVELVVVDQERIAELFIAKFGSGIVQHSSD
jgi:Restriction endonuclease